MASGVDSLINQLYEMIQDAWGVPLSSDKCVITRDKALDLLDEINYQLPTELKRAQEILAKKEEYEEAAKKEAEIIKQKAEAHAKQMMSEQEIVNAARKKANEMVAAAEAKAKEMRRVSNEYADEALKRAEEVVSNALNDIRQSRARFRNAAISPLKKKEDE